MLAYLLAVVVDVLMSDPPPVLTPPPHNYLHPPGDQCDSRAASGEIVVCGDKDASERYRLHSVEDNPLYADLPIRAQVKLGNGTLALHNEDKDFGGQHSKRAMITFTLPF